jgi:hypothetical protein
MHRGEQHKFKAKPAKKQRVKTCETAAQIATQQPKDFETTAKTASRQDKLRNCRSGEKIRFTNTNPEDEYGMLTELAKRVKVLERHQTTSTRRLHAEIDALVRKVSDV